MKILYINTTEKILSLALSNNNIIKCVNGNENTTQTEQLFTLLKELLNELKISDIDLIVALTGPGSFTGIRLGLAFIKGLKIATNKPIICIDNFKASYLSIKNTKETLPKEFYIKIEANKTESYITKLNNEGEILEKAKIIKTDEITNLKLKIIEGVINPEKILNYFNTNFDPSNFTPSPIIPTYIKPHYAKKS